jgi:hypothetical protein
VPKKELKSKKIYNIDINRNKKKFQKIILTLFNSLEVFDSVTNDDF